eukprot:scaffold1299_cov385-Pavlova_lutheri.AAC.17
MGVGGGGTTSAGLIQILANESVVDVVEVAMDEVTSDIGNSPITSPGENALQIMATLRGRTWTSTHNKALLYVVRDEDCCFLEKRTNRIKSNAWKLFEERLKRTYSKQFGSGGSASRHRTGGGMVDEELAQLCDEVAERVSVAKTPKGAAHAKKARAREMKE